VPRHWSPRRLAAARTTNQAIPSAGVIVSVSTASSSSTTAVSLLTVAPEFADAVPAADRLLARRLLMVDARRVGPGRWVPDPGPHASMLLILGGVALREVLLAERRSAQVLGPGDVFRPAAIDEASVYHRVEWTAMTVTHVAVLGDAFLAAARRWPAVEALLLDRLLAQAERLAVHLAIAELPRIEQRVLAILWQLADRWGRMTSHGVVLPLTLTHDAIGRLVGARRPTVSLGLSTLQDRGDVRRQLDGSWVLDPASRDLLLHADADEPVAIRPAQRHTG
jgi:CRP/FNR family cyclic AMP-dependent transcriptional regulator